MQVIAAFIIALIFTLIAIPSYKGKDVTYGPVIVFFLLLFMSGIASQYWVKPIGPSWFGISWVPLFFILFIVSFLFIAPSPYERKKQEEDNSHISASTATAVSIFIWLLLLLLVIAVISGVFNT